MSVFEKPPNRDKQFKVMLTPKERQELEDAAAEFDMTASDLVREAVNQYVKRRRKRKKK